MKPLHTEGEWEIESTAYFTSIKAGNQRICTVLDIDNNKNFLSEDYAIEQKRCDMEREANAYLCAAAPNLLAALVEAKRCLLERIRIDYSKLGYSDNVSKSMAAVDIKEFLLTNAINKATNK